ncbi:DUF2752 domain-containing protein [Agathobaculum sp.]|uniref:DUF2752 domain-containing protein n=1 Tax=Agathobaculum sp. TaxID=2048138 RepID=UPI002A83BCE5|nr:DUF2752 domain-containing protein [Agathobaculum sp.]MDY3619345.1 DUF2752 domain-containing protein [Agathobaculum sp.]
MKKGFKGLAVLLVLIAAVYTSAAVAGWGCPVQRVTGVGCPGCGLSRAAAALVRGDFAGAFRLHPMVYVLPPTVLFVLFGKKPLLGSKARERALLWGVIALWIVIWVARLLLRDPVLLG